MGIEASLHNKVARHLFSPKRRDTKRRKFERQRRARNAPHVVEYYHQVEMFGHGIWGVPSFHVNETATWGQDRLWVIEEALAAYREVSK